MTFFVQAHMTDWKFALRSLARRPGFSITVVGLLVLGVGANTALFSLVDTVLLKPLPYPEARQLVSVFEASPAKGEKQSLIAPGRLEDWNRLNRTFSVIAGSYAENVTDTSGQEPIRLSGRRVSPRYFDVFQSQPILGRTFTPEEEIAGGRLAAVIGYGLWTRGKKVGQTLSIGGQAFTIVGVMGKLFTSANVDVWLPAQTGAFLLQARDARFYSGVGRMKPGVTPAQAQADLDRIQHALGEQFPKTDRGWSSMVRDLKDARVGDSRRAVLLLFGAVGLLMSITLTNVASLFLAELGKREKELAIRTSIGASRLQIVAGVIREALLLAAAGSLGGWGVAALSIGLMRKTFADIARIDELTLDWLPMVFAMALSAMGAIAFGLIPALRATGLKRSANLFRAGRGVAGGRQAAQRVMVTCQIAATMVLLVSAVLLWLSFDRLSHADAGFDASHAYVFHVGAAWDEDRAQVGRLQERIVASLQRLPGVEAAGITNFLPASGAKLRNELLLFGQKVQAGTRQVSPGYLQAIRAPLIAGKWCPELRYDPKALPRVMVNRRFSDMYGGGTNLVGRSLDRMEIVGVIGNLKEDALNAPDYPYVYYCIMGGNWPDPEYVVRASGDPSAAIRQLVHNADPTRAVFGMKKLAGVVDADLDRPRSNAGLMGLFAIVAMTLAAAGLHGLVTQIVNARRQEIGVRIALGASQARILRSVLGSAAALAGLGIAAGTALTLALGRILQSVLFGIGGSDKWSILAAASLLGIVSILAAVIPARRAAAIDPMEAIRAE